MGVVLGMIWSACIGIYSDKNPAMDCAAGVFFGVAYFPSTV